MDRQPGEPKPIYDVQPLRLLKDLLGITDRPAATDPENGRLDDGHPGPIESGE